MALIKYHHQQPPKDGVLHFSVFGKPVSFQSSKSHKERIIRKIQQIVAPVEYILSGDVEFEIQWIVPEKYRYESDSSPDVDNIIKPTLDALVGPNGIMIDDCQVKSVKRYWEDWEKREQQVNIKIIFDSDHWLRMEGLKFIHVENGLCFPFPIGIPEDSVPAYVQLIRTAVKAKSKLELNLEDYYRVRLILPVQRFYHKSRLSKFEVIEASSF